MAGEWGATQTTLTSLEFSLEEMRDLLDARDRLAERIDDDERRRLTDRLALYADAAETRCEKLRQQLQSARRVAATLRREAAHKRRSPGLRP